MHLKGRCYVCFLNAWRWKKMRGERKYNDFNEICIVSHLKILVLALLIMCYEKIVDLVEKMKCG